MFRYRTLIYNSTFFLNCFLFFLLLFEDGLVIPPWLVFAGRLHPLLLHFPIVILILYGIWVLVVRKENKPLWISDIANYLLLLGSLTAVLTSLVGLILSKEPGYEPDSVFWHKWMGIITSLLSLLLYGFRKRIVPEQWSSKVIAIFLLIVIMITGHLGGDLTHGEDFLLVTGKEEESKETVSMDDALVYQDVIHPILEQKCFSCHNEKKAKGELRMDTPELLLKGGKNGVLWDTTQADLGLLMRRVHLPLEDKKHMAPKGKPQLTTEEILVLESWIRLGADIRQKVTELPVEHPIYQLARRMLGNTGHEESYNFDPADPGMISKLNTNYRVITPLSAESPAISVNFYNRESFTIKDVEDLLELKNQIVSIDLSKMPVKDADLAVLAKFTELRQLLLNFTDVKGEGLGELKKLPNLKRLSLTGTQVDYAQLKPVASFPALNYLYVWNTRVKPEEAEKLKKELPKIRLESGYRSDTIKLKLNTPIILNEEPILNDTSRIRLKHQIPGTVIRYTLDGSTPDSVQSLIYKSGIKIADNSVLRARAYREGWYGSEVVERSFFKAGYPIDSVALITPTAPDYRSKGGKTLFDGIKSDDEFRNGKWLGYRENHMDALIMLKKAFPVKSVTLSMVWNIGGFIFPPKKIEVWGGTNANQLHLLSTLNPEMPTKDSPNRKLLLYAAKFPVEEIKFIRIKAYPSGLLPDWHASRGQKTWIFIDEVFVN